MIPTTTSTGKSMVQTRYQNRFSAEGAGLWTAGEHARFLEALKVYPSGPWRAIAAFVGTRNVRQTMTHAQKHKQKIARHERGLRTKRQRPVSSTTKSLRRVEPTPTESSSDSDDVEVDELLPLLQEMPLLQEQPAVDYAMTPLSVGIPSEFKTEKFDDEQVLATPVVADCLDYLVRCYAY